MGNWGAMCGSFYVFPIFGPSHWEEKGCKSLRGRGNCLLSPSPSSWLCYSHWLRWNCTLQVRAQDKPELRIIYPKISWVRLRNIKSVGTASGHALICLCLAFWRVAYKKPHIMQLIFQLWSTSSWVAHLSQCLYFSHWISLPLNM